MTEPTPAPTPKLVRVSVSHHGGLALASESLADPHQWSPLVWLVGAHGGAGVSTLAHSIAPCGDAGQQWPVHDQFPWCVIVARSTRSGVEAAHDAALQAQVGKAGHCRVLGVILVDDAPGKTPKSVEQKITVVKKVVPMIWRVPYFPQWREVLNDELPVWSPLDDHDDEPQQDHSVARFARKKKTPSALEVVPAIVQTIGQEMIDLAREANSHVKSF